MRRTVTHDIGGSRKASPDSVFQTLSLYRCLKSMRNPRGLLRTLDAEFRLLSWRAGNSAAVFEIMTDDGRHLMLKCYIRPKRNLAAIYGERFRQQELYVFGDGSGGTYTDVVVDEWIEGATLAEHMADAAKTGDSARIARLAAAFDDMARSMLADECAHGDLKPENIVVTEDMQLRLIDFDAAYVPALRGCRCEEIGTEAWQHPSRTYDDFDRHLDDYSIALISTTLHALAAEPEIFLRHADADGSVIEPHEASTGGSEALACIENLFARKCMPVQYRIATLLRSHAYRLPQLAEYMSYGADRFAVCEGRIPEPDAAYGLWGYKLDDKFVVPPLFDDCMPVRSGRAEVVLGGIRHEITLG